MASEIITVYECKDYKVFYQAEPYHRYWKQYKDGREEKIKSVSGISKMLDKSKYLIGWATELTANYIIKLLPDILAGKLILTPADAEELFYKAKTENERALKRAGDYGTLVHATVEQYLKAKYLGIGKLPTGLPDAIRQSMEGFKRLIKEIGLTRVIASEQIMYSKTWNVGGTVDIVAEVAGRTEILDIKTSKGFYDDQPIQLSAYREIWNESYEEEATGIRVIRLDKVPPYLPYQRDFTSIQDCAFQQFLCLLEVSELQDKIKIVKNNL